MMKSPKKFFTAATTEETDGRPGGFTAWLVAGVFIVFIIVAGVFVVVSNHNASNPEASTTTPAPSDECAERVVSREHPEKAPEGIRWEPLDEHVMLPYHPDYGPTIIEGPVARCFSRDPMGAVMAATHINSRGLQNANPKDAVVVLEQQVTDSLAREEVIESRRAGQEATTGQWTGFNVGPFSETEVNVILAMSDGQGNHAFLFVPMRWVDGDWKLVSEKTAVRQMNDVELHEKFIPWSENAW